MLSISLLQYHMYMYSGLYESTSSSLTGSLASSFSYTGSGFTLVMQTQIGDTNEYAEQELIHHFLCNAMGKPKDPPIDKKDLSRYIHTCMVSPASCLYTSDAKETKSKTSAVHIEMLSGHITRELFLCLIVVVVVRICSECEACLQCRCSQSHSQLLQCQ